VKSKVVDLIAGLQPFLVECFTLDAFRGDSKWFII
jgi:hypothetical protein